MSNRKPMYFDTLKKDYLYLLTPKLGNPTGDKTLLSPMYFPRNILEEAISGVEFKGKQKFQETYTGKDLREMYGAKTPLAPTATEEEKAERIDILKLGAPILNAAEDEPA